MELDHLDCTHHVIFTLETLCIHLPRFGVQQRLAGHPWPSPVVGLFLLDHFFDYDVIDILLFKIVYASFVIQRSPLDFSSQFQQTKVSKQHFSAQVATAAPQSNSFTPSPAAKTGAASGVPPNL